MDNRLIKFRAWDLQDRQWRTNSCTITAEGKIKLMFIDDNHHFHCFSVNNNDIVIQQFTGLNDKNNKEIYEGDILKISDQDRENYFKDHCHVWYSEYSGSWVVSFNHMYSETSCDLYMVNRQYEVIGNIFENPELLK